MPTLGSHLNFAQLEARNAVVHNLSVAPGSPIKGQLYFDTVANALLWWNGTAWINASGGVTPDATSSAKGVVQLAGDLAGTAAAPVVAALAITDAKVAAANKDGAVAVPSLRTLGLGAAQAMPGNERLDQITAPTAPVSLNSQRVINQADPTLAQDSATKNYVDIAANTDTWKNSVRCVATTNNALSGLTAIDGYTPIAGDRVLCIGQTTTSANGIYVAAAGAWARSTDMNLWTQVVSAQVPVEQGTVNADTLWNSTVNQGGTLGATAITFVQVPSSLNIGPGSPSGAALPATARLDQITANQTAAAVQMNANRIMGLADPIIAQDAATKNYVDTVALGLEAKTTCVCATTANITLSALQAIDGYTTLAGDRVLVKNQTTASANGIYVAAAGAWARATDMDTWAEVPSAFVWIEQGTTQADTGWVCTSDPGGTLGTTSIAWTQFSGAAQITAGAGITKTGNTLSATVDGVTIDAAGAGTSLEIKPGGVGGTQLGAAAVDLTTKVTGILPVANGGTSQSTAKAARETGLGAAGYYNNNATHIAGTTITITQATHGLRSGRGIHVQVSDNTTGNVELPDISIASNGDVTITYAVALTANTKMVALVG